MKKIFFISILFMVLLAFGVSAKVNVNYNFLDIQTTYSLNNVDTLAYPCLDAGCNGVMLNKPLQGVGNSGSSSNTIITYPTNLVTRYGYAVFYFRSGYVPEESKADWRGDGNTRYSIAFDKIYSCKSNITEFDVDADDNGDVLIDSSIISAFSRANKIVGYIPPAYRSYYSSVVNTNVTVYDENNTAVYNSTRTDSIFMDDSVDFRSSMNLESGNYTAVIKTYVADDKCASSLTRERQVEFEIPAAQIPALNVTLTADPIFGTEPLNVTLNCSVQGGVIPYNYSFFDDGILFFSRETDDNSVSLNRTFAAGNHTVLCFVEDSDGRNDSDSVIINVTAQHVPECRDGIDNDNDNHTDYPADPGCENADDDNETDILILPECSDLMDNDGDGFIDFPADPGCINATDDNESDHPHVCENHFNITSVLMNGDNITEWHTYHVNNLDVLNGYIPFDYNITNTGSSRINQSSYATTLTNDAEGSLSYITSLLPDFEPYSSFIEEDNRTLPDDLVNGTYNMTVAVIGNDAYGCEQYDEFRFFLVVNTSSNTTYECSDGIDNDGDGYIDYPADLGCTNETDDDETDPAINYPPVVELLFPPDNTTYTIGQAVFIYNVSDDYTNLLECTLYSNITGTFAPMETQFTLNHGIGFFDQSNIPDGTYIWNVECDDGMLSAFAPRNWTFTINTTGYTDIPADVNITATPQTGNSPLGVQFNSSVRGNPIITYSWNFGDGATSTMPNPYHTYNNAGNYMATLTITDADGDTASDSVIITVTSPAGDGDSDGDDDEDDDHDVEYDLYIGRINIFSDIAKNYGEGYVKAGQELYVDTNFENLGSRNLDDINYRVAILDLGIMNSVKFDLDSGDHSTERVVLDIPADVEPGDYDVQITASNQQIRRVKYRFVTVLE
jgi:hypothetical protein